MTIARPGRPQDLPAPELLWARWGLVAVLRATAADEERGGRRTGHWIDDTGLRLDDCGCTWWTLSRVGEGRFVLYGEDESSAVKWHEPPIDMLATAPDWLPHDRLRDLLEGWELGCIYWYEDGAWGRAPYPADLSDDGLDCGMSRFVDRSDLLRDVAYDDQDWGKVADRAEELVTAAESYRLTPAALRAVVGDSPAAARDLPAMLRTLERTGLAGTGLAGTGPERTGLAGTGPERTGPLA
ncbi:hypothetical protein [Streptomyces antimicrobicus]|uniref:Uncharacterized protein n=1 Tax=Streptomyces antimicrobicus TaxID=2883108 RepID=A0ABS8B4T2_9ACTN|nr:hypothetical protein [Streptomyces antimicrobicus]MCB5179586.1 hypothetical protein [Streptomyces antimicrobicus]